MQKLSQAQRVIKILEWLSLGQKLTTSEILGRFDHSCDLRSIQRDIKIIDRAGIPILDERDEEGRICWYLPRDYRNMIPQTVQSDELSSFYLLKTFVSKFKGTRIEKEISSLQDKLEELVPGDVFIDFGGEGQVLWDQSFGQMDYTGNPGIIEEITELIRDKTWMRITYQSPGKEKPSEFDILFRRLFYYNGALYAVAWQPYYKNDIAIAVHRIVEMEKSKKGYIEPPLFNEEEFKNKRFGVFGGESTQVTLQINKDYEDYFTGRNWHASQKLTRNKQKQLQLKIEVPLSPELISWIIGWHEAIKVLAPGELKNIIMDYVDRIKNQYLERE